MIRPPAIEFWQVWSWPNEKPLLYALPRTLKNGTSQQAIDVYWDDPRRGMYPTELHSNSKQCERFHLTYDQHNGRNKCSYPNMVVTRVCGSRTHFLIPLGRPTFLFSRFSVGSILIYPELDYKFKRTKICIIKLCCTTAHLKCSCWLRTLTFHKTSTPDPL